MNQFSIVKLEKDSGFSRHDDLTAQHRNRDRFYGQESTLKLRVGLEANFDFHNPLTVGSRVDQLVTKVTRTRIMLY